MSDIKKCIICSRDKDLKIETYMETVFIKSKKMYYTVKSQHHICNNCNFSVWINEDLDNNAKFMEEAIKNSEGYYLGKQVYNVLSKYHISAEDFEKIFEWKIKEFSNKSLMFIKEIELFLKKPVAFYILLNAKKENLEPENYKRINKIVTQYITGEREFEERDELDY